MVQRFVAYERVSTARQGASGLGLEAQRNTIDAFAAARAAEILARFTRLKAARLPTGQNCLQPFNRQGSPVPRWSLPNWTGYRAMRPSC